MDMTTVQTTAQCGAIEEKEVDEVGSQLELLPKTLLQFTQTLRSLYLENMVVQRTEATERFIEIRDNVAKNTLVYANKVLPLTQEVIRSIAFFADTFNSLELEDWNDCLDDIVDELEKAQGLCDLLKMMHNTIIQDLMKNKDKAEVSIELLQKLKDNYEEKFRELTQQLEAVQPEVSIKLYSAQQKTVLAETHRFWATALAVPTLGIGYWVHTKLAKQAEMKAQADEASANQMLETSANLECEKRAVDANSSIASKAAALTETHLIPALKNFLDGLEVCSTFLGVTKEKVKAMHGTGNMALEKDRKKMYFTMMKRKSTQLNSHCEMFLARSDMIQNNMAGIPSDICRGEGVNFLFGKMINDFAATNKEAWAKIHSPVLAITNKGGQA